MNYHEDYDLSSYAPSVSMLIYIEMIGCIKRSTTRGSRRSVLTNTESISTISSGNSLVSRGVLPRVRPSEMKQREQKYVFNIKVVNLYPSLFSM